MARTARAFSESVSYATGDLVLYNGALYVFTAAHAAGAWTGSDAGAYDSTAAAEVNRVLSALDSAKAAISYAGKVRFEPDEITGTRYRYILTTN